MSNPAPQLVQKLWNYCNILRDDGLSYGDYVEQLTFLLFLKMAEVERWLSLVEELESVVTANLQRATRLRQSILQKAFTGKL
jgi:type I restriction-modification system DNA methylase subunit